MSGRIAKSQIPLLPRASLPPDASLALMNAKNDLKDPRRRILLRPFGNTQGRTPLEGPPLPKLDQGCEYFEVQVGQAHPGDARQAGARRLVLEVNTSSWQLIETYFSDEHYAKFSFVRVV